MLIQSSLFAQSVIVPSGLNGTGAVDDSGAIQAALTLAGTAASSNGLTAVVALPPGTYLCASTLVMFPNTILCALCGRDTVIVRASAAIPIVNGYAPLLVNKRYASGFGGAYDDNIQLRDITFDLNSAVTIAPNGNPIRFLAVQDLLIERCTFQNGLHSLLLVADASANTNQSIIRPIVRDCLFDGTANVTSDLIDFGNCQNGRFQNNTIQNNASGNAFSCDYATDTIIEKNTLVNNATTNLSIQPMSGCKVLDNRVSGGMWGIQCSSNPLAPTTNIQDLIIRGNHVSGTSLSALLLQTSGVGAVPTYGAAGNTPQRVIITENSLHDSQHAGIELQWCDNVIIKGNILARNSLVGAGTWAAIHCTSQGAPGQSANTNITIVDNHFYDDGTPTQTKGIIANQADKVTVYANSVQNITAGNFLGIAGANNGVGLYKSGGNRGYNPRSQIVGAVLNTTSVVICNPVMGVSGQPTVGTAYTNISGVDIIMTVSATGTVTSVSMDGITLFTAALTIGQEIQWPNGSAITFAGTVNPTLTCYGN